MEERKLTKADIDKVRHIEGFPIGKDEDIIALSRPPYYTACPNPFIEDFIRENGTPYDEATDDYHREPFAADVSEGKKEPVYNAHSYHTKVPYKAIMRYILHYTKPGDIVFDGFCGSGMTAVAAQMCGCPDSGFKLQVESEMPGIKWGARKAIISDLSPAATFISSIYNTAVNTDVVETRLKEILKSCTKKYSWMYETTHTHESRTPVIGIDGSPIIGHINYTVWSDVFVCPSCSAEFSFWDVAVDAQTGKVSSEFQCPSCHSLLRKRDCEHAKVTFFDKYIGATQSVSKQVPVLISYQAEGKEFLKKPSEEDIALIEKASQVKCDHALPTMKWMTGEKTQEPIRYGIEYIHQIYFERTQVILGTVWNEIRSLDNVAEREKQAMMSALTGVMLSLTKLQRFKLFSGFPNMILSGTLYIGSLQREWNPLDWIEGKLGSILKLKSRINTFPANGALISTNSTTDKSIYPEDSVDYIFTDPPFGNNLDYSELNAIWESWLKVQTNNAQEAIMHPIQKKGLAEYQGLMERCFRTYYKVLKPNRWMTVEFHNSKNAVWNAIQEAFNRAGFIVADIRIINKQQGSFNQITASGAVQQDLVISAYKPKESFVREFQARAGEPEMAWEFVRQHLRNVPVVADGNHDGKLDVIAERQDYLLFDRMVAWHIMNGIPVPMDAHTFYDGLRQRFLQRDGMFFLPDQVNEYDDKRAHMELDAQQLSFLVTDEKNAIAWLNYILSEGPKTYQEIQPAYLQELHQSKQEKMPELLDMLRENFVQDDKGAWYVPDLSNAADLAKVRRKALLKEFYDSCVPGKGKLKVFRMEAIRAGFDECWKARDFKTIVSVGERLPESVLQEDPALLMYYDNACSRV